MSTTYQRQEVKALLPTGRWLTRDGNFLVKHNQFAKQSNKFSKPTKLCRVPSRCRAAIWRILCCSSHLVNAGLPAGEGEGEAQRKASTFDPHVLQKLGYALDNMVKELEGKKKNINLMSNPMQWALAGSLKQSFEITSSPVPCMISKGMAKILLYICTDLFLPLLILTSRTLKFVPPRSRARNFPFSEGEERYFTWYC